MEMKYGQIAPGKNVNRKIYKCFEYLCEDDVRKFIKKFREQPHNGEQIMHTFKELILGAFLASNDLRVRFDCKVNGKTPDWCIIDNYLSIIGIIELINFHIDRETEKAMLSKIEKSKIWVGWLKPNNARLYQKILEKADIYNTIITSKQIPYVVSVIGDFKAALSFDEVNECVFKEHGGLFHSRPILSGVLFFEESGGDRYSFNYIQNPHATIEFDLPSGVF